MFDYFEMAYHPKKGEFLKPQANSGFGRQSIYVKQVIFKLRNFCWDFSQYWKTISVFLACVLADNSVRKYMKT